MVNVYLSAWFEVLDFSNRVFYTLSSWGYPEIIDMFSTIVGGLSARRTESHGDWGKEWYIISGSETVITLENVFLREDDWNIRKDYWYVDPAECRRFAEVFYTNNEKRRPGELPEDKKFVKIADVFSLGSIMNGVVM